MVGNRGEESEMGGNVGEGLRADKTAKESKSVTKEKQQFIFSVVVKPCTFTLSLSLSVPDLMTNPTASLR